MSLAGHPLKQPIKRRTFLQSMGLGTIATLAAPSQLLSPALAAPAPPLAMRARQPAFTRQLGPPTLPDIAVIALNRMAFGPRPGDFEAFQALGKTPAARLTAYVEQQLAPEDIDDQELATRLAAMNFVTLDKSLEQLWLDYVIPDNDDRMLPLWETLAATFLKAVYSKRQLVEVLADFWHNHFNVWGWMYEVAPVFVHYDRDVIRRHMLGNFREMLEAVATSPAMLYYLDNFINSRAGPNENYARELFELHTLGAENYLGVARQRSVPGYDEGAPIGYVDDDVYEATRAFTGWRVNDNDWEEGVENTGTFLYYDRWHDRFQKTVLGRFLPADQEPMKDGRDVLDALAEHPGTGRFIARKLCRRLIADDPPEDIVQEAATVFTAQRHAPDQLSQVVRTILLSDAFKTTWGDKIKRPFEAIISTLRATDADFTPTRDFVWIFNLGGQGLFSWTAPDGYPDTKADWSTTMSILQRWRITNAMIEGWVEGVQIDPLPQTPDHLRTPSALADFWIERILHRPMAAADRQEVVDLIAQGRNPDFALSSEQIAERLPSMVGLILMSPDFQYR
ncbi:MAG: DUF1800 domain-containing protein [Chloroflexi bacterium]|nr:DUF1800 domain-containing protein [Chloroflexota bacterium]